ncbi:unnamed protein product [Linum tenue]|uniref:Uncharacterized protein n=1 Tax=Linum tenue TaxID=586396 RepID=A0AAV0HWA8_9ROSI|nr:unnamed protein product [Linum tenue]
MSSAADPTNQAAVARKPKTPFKFLIPLIYAPVLPLIRLSLRRNPVLRDRLFTAVLAGAFIHGGYLVYPFSPLTIKLWFDIYLLLSIDSFSYFYVGMLVGLHLRRSINLHLAYVF